MAGILNGCDHNANPLIWFTLSARDPPPPAPARSSPPPRPPPPPAVFRGDAVANPAGRKISHPRPRALGENQFRRQRQRIPFADVLAVLVPHAKPVRARVLRKTHPRPLPTHPVRQAG